MRRNSVSLRLPPHLLDRLRQLAEREATSVNWSVALAEKIARPDAEAFCQARADRSEAGDGWRALDKMGRNTPLLSPAGQWRRVLPKGPWRQ